LLAAVMALLAGTLAVVGVSVWLLRRDVAFKTLQRQVLDEADLAVRLLEQAAVRPPGASDSATAPTRALLRTTLEGFPGYLIVLDDSGRTRYASFAVRKLAQDDLAALLQASLQLSAARPALKVTLDSDQVMIVSRAAARAPERIVRVVAGASTRPLALEPTAFLGPMLLLSPLILLVAASIGWWLVDRTLAPVDRLIADAEAITDGRSLHRRLYVPEGADAAGDELAQLATTLNGMIARLESSFAALRRFTADASHELKTPLTVLRAAIERAMATAATPADQFVALEEALVEVARMTDLVEGLLTLARADEGRFDLVRAPVALGALVQDVLETGQILGEEAGLDVSLQVLEDGRVEGDPARLRQVMLNLVTNAIKYTPRGGRVELSLTRRPEGLAFAVRDTGIGISAADLPHVFERFWRADRARTRSDERGGTGLGLAISQYIAQAHGGTLAVQSRLGRGTVFTLTLPEVAVSSEGSPTAG
jgi:heavy metal sensor kinase